MNASRFTCGYCAHLVAAHLGFHGSQGNIYVCPNCENPTYFRDFEPQVPGVAPGENVQNVPPDIDALYLEARKSLAADAPTASVLTCRKLLMSIAVAQGAGEGKPFIEYVEYLANNGYVPPNGKGWVDHIRTKGNEANHEIQLMTATDSEELISFIEMLLKFIYEFPARVPASSPASP